MAKLFEVEGEKANAKKGILVVFGVLAIIVAALVNYNIDEPIEELSTEAMVGVHVKGAVENSGFYRVPFGTRVCDLEKYIGSFSENADLDGVNLAEYIYDGQELYIPYKGTPQSGALNLNKATYEELLYVEGIGDTYASKIIKYRNERGAFEKVIELKSVLGTKVYEAVRESFYVD